MNLINGIIITFISKLEWGTVADWVSGIGSLIAIGFAYWQIAEQRKQYKKDKADEIRQEALTNRPFFSLIQLLYFKKGEDHLWIMNEDTRTSVNDILGDVIQDYCFFKNGIYVYEFTNVSKAIATNVALKIEYQDKASDEILKIDYCNIRSCVMGNERAIILPHSIINESSTYAHWPKKISLYFTTIDNRAYRQRWIEKYSESSLHMEQVDIKEVSIEELPNEWVYTRLNV